MSLANSPSVEAAWGELITAYEKQNPNVTIMRTPVAYGAGDSSYRDKAKLAASSPSAPDLVEGDMGPGGVISSLVADGLLHPLDSYSTQYGWPQEVRVVHRASSSSRATASASATGPSTASPTSPRSSASSTTSTLLDKLGLQPPQTIADFEATLKAAKAAGMTPITIGGLDQFPWSHTCTTSSRDQYGSVRGADQLVPGRPRLDGRHARDDAGRSDAPVLVFGTATSRTAPTASATPTPVTRFAAGDARSTKFDGPW